MDAAGLIGMDTFENGQVTFRPGPIYLCARYGGFGVLDEINMAKKTRRWRFCTPRWISAGRSMCRAMTG